MRHPVYPGIYGYESGTAGRRNRNSKFRSFIPASPLDEIETAEIETTCRGTISYLFQQILLNVCRHPTANVSASPLVEPFYVNCFVSRNRCKSLPAGAALICAEKRFLESGVDFCIAIGSFRT